MKRDLLIIQNLKGDGIFWLTKKTIFLNLINADIKSMENELMVYDQFPINYSDLTIVRELLQRIDKIYLEGELQIKLYRENVEDIEINSIILECRIKWE